MYVELSVVVPVYHEEDVLPLLAQRLDALHDHADEEVQDHEGGQDGEREEEQPGQRHILHRLAHDLVEIIHGPEPEHRYKRGSYAVSSSHLTLPTT